MARIGALIAGDKFRTLLTERSGHILPTQPGMDPDTALGVWTEFDDGETKVLHPEVVVELTARYL